MILWGSLVAFVFLSLVTVVAWRRQDYASAAIIGAFNFVYVVDLAYVSLTERV